jgi:hypothetical protein
MNESSDTSAEDSQADPLHQNSPERQQRASAQVLL